MQIQLTMEDPVSKMWGEKNFYTNVVDPVDLEVLVDDVAVLWSNLLVSKINIAFNEAFFEGSPDVVYAGSRIDLPGARISLSYQNVAARTSCFYYFVKHGNNPPSRRLLYWAHYLHEIVDGYMIDSLYDYLVEHLTLLYDTPGVVIYDWKYNELKFDHLSPKLYHKKGYRYPYQGFNQHWPVGS